MDVAARAGVLQPHRQWLAERLRQHRGNADVVRQDLARELGIRVSLSTVQRAVESGSATTNDFFASAIRPSAEGTLTLNDYPHPRYLFPRWLPSSSTPVPRAAWRGRWAPSPGRPQIMRSDNGGAFCPRPDDRPSP
jgi:hypothetical protein